MIKHFCDFCEKETQEKDLNRLCLYQNTIRSLLRPDEWHFEICKECTEKFLNREIVRVAPVQQEKPKEEKAPKEAARQQASKNNIDHGKVWALRKAGWPVKEICAEMKISDASVYIICKKMKALEEAAKNADH
jgi:hypothetical protein